MGGVAVVTNMTVLQTEVTLMSIRATGTIGARAGVPRTAEIMSFTIADVPAVLNDRQVVVAGTRALVRFGFVLHTADLRRVERRGTND